MMGIRFEGESTNTEYVPNERIVTESKGGISSSWRWTFVPENGKTRLTLVVDYTIPVPVLGKLAEAAASLQQACELRQELGQLPLEMESRAGLARVALARGAKDEAQRQIDRVLAYLDSGQELGGTEVPFLIHLTCIQVLEANQDPRAGEVLRRVYGRLQERAASIPDEATRRAFLEKVPWHREIVRTGEGRAL